MKKLLLRLLVLIAVLAAVAAAVCRFGFPHVWPRPVPIGSRERTPAPGGVSAREHRPISLAAPAPAADDLRAAMGKASIVICVLDAARADHCGAYGYPRDTTPNLDALARQSLVFDQHFCQYSQTSPSTACLFTSQYPDTHNVGVPRKGVKQLGSLPPEAFTLEKGVTIAGLRTLLFTNTPAAAPGLGLGADFEFSSTPAGIMPDNPEFQTRRRPDWMLAQVKTALSQVASSRFLAYVHFLPPHYPYEAPQQMKALYQGQQAPGHREGEAAFTKVSAPFGADVVPTPRREWVNLYDANLRWADSALGRLVDLLKRTGRFDNTLLIVTADHGEALGEHRYEFHASCPYDEAIHIPLLIKFPGDRGPVGRVGALTETVDLMPTLLDLCGIPYSPAVVQGRSLLPLITGKANQVHDYVFCRTNGDHPCYVVRDRRSSLLLYQGGRLRAYYDLADDPGQTRNLLRDHPAEVAKLTQAFRSFAKAQKYPPLDFVDPGFRVVVPDPSAGAMSEETRRQLRALGYTR